ncbi:MAG: 6-bladed beta-propeller [bacterium]
MRRTIPIILLLSLAMILWAQEKEDFDVKVDRADDHFRVAYEAFCQGDYKTAEKEYKIAISFAPYYARPHYWLGRLYYKLGLLREASDKMLDTMELDIPPKEWLTKSEVRKWLGIIEGRDETMRTLLSYTHAFTISGVKWDRSSFFAPSGIALDKSGFIYVASRSGNKVIKIDTNGRLLMSIGDTPLSNKEGKFNGPFDVALGVNNNIYVTDFGNDRVQKFSPTGRFLMSFGGPGLEPGKFHGPEGIALDEGGNIYVVDSGNNRVQKFDNNGKFLMAFGRRGTGDGEFDKPSGVAIDPTGHILVTDYNNNRVQEFDPSGNFIRSFGEKILEGPRGIIVDQNNDVYIVTDGGALAKFDSNRQFLFQRRSWEANGGRKPREVSYKAPLDVALDAHNFIYTVDYDRHTIDAFMPMEFAQQKFSVVISRIDARYFPLIIAYVTLSSKDRKPIVGLTKNNFLIRENDVDIFPSEVVSTEQKQEKISVVLAIDRSLAMKKNRELVLSLLRDFVGRTQEEDFISIANFNTEVELTQRFTTKKDLILEVLSSPAKYQGETHALYDGIYESVFQCIDLLGRKAVLVVTDSSITDDVSKHEVKEAIWIAEVNAVPVYIVDFGDSEDLRALARRSGGEYYSARTSNKLGTIYREITNTSPNQYILVYRTSEIPRRDRWRNVEIRAYYAGKEEYDRALYWGP